ncbi:hypothetical protein [Bradyrhizobium mercantei]|uniref:hypothetical protein n=1 Tax=Bradyrhizobium mercantei TaxID=1904807 RepID=UPI0011781CAC|nr:hypothetical protein [Bradyrhizobium mercantei]
MKLLSILGPAICVAAFAAQAQADSIEYQCRAAVRAEMKGPDCRVVVPTTANCLIPAPGSIERLDNEVIKCVKQGGPGRGRQS